MKYGEAVQEPVMIEGAKYFSLEELVPIPCGDFLERGFVTDLNMALKTAIESTTVFSEGMKNLLCLLYFCIVFFCV